MKSYFLTISIMFATTICSAQTVTVYPAPIQGFAKVSDKYIVNVTLGTVTKNSIVYKSVAGTGATREWGREQGNSFSFTTFSFSGPITIEVTKKNSSASSAIIRPNRLGIGSVQAVSQNSNRKVVFKINKASKVSVEFDDDPAGKDALMIFADNQENSTDVPASTASYVFFAKDSASLKNIPSNKSIVYFKPGVYKIGYWDIPANIQQVYIAGGAYVLGYLNRDKATIKINGRGILSNGDYGYHYPSVGQIKEDYNSWYRAIKISGGQNHIIEGITIIEATSYNIAAYANNILIKNVKINGFRFNNDGISIGGHDNRIEDCFIRSNDDGITPSGSNLTVTNCVFWQLQGSCIQLGWAAHSMDNIIISKCDVIHDKGTNSEGNVGFINAMNFSSAMRPAEIKGVTVSDVNFDTPILRFIDIRKDRNFRLGDKAADLASAPWVYKNFHFSNIHFNQGDSKFPLVYLHGFSDDHPMEDFIFENIYVNNGKIGSDKLMNNSFIHTKNINGLKIK